MNIAPVWGCEKLGTQLAAGLRSEGFVPNEGSVFWVCAVCSCEIIGFAYISEPLKFSIFSVFNFFTSGDTYGRENGYGKLSGECYGGYSWQRDDWESHTLILLQPLSAQATRHTRALSQVLKESTDTLAGR